jgi:hypothetical protein
MKIQWVREAGMASLSISHQSADTGLGPHDVLFYTHIKLGS